MTIEILKPDRIVSVGLGLLAREVTLPSLVWRDAAGDFAGAKDDTISLRLPAYATARTRNLRSGSTRTRDSLSERKVDVTLSTDVYKDVRITDEELTLDISDFGAQVMNPAMAAVARKIEDLLVAEMQGATYANSVEIDPTATFDGFVDARKHLNDARVPLTGRVAVVGSSIEAAVLKDAQFARYTNAGDTSALRDAAIGRIAGMEVISSPALDPDEGYVFHKTAFVLSTRAPQVPAGAPFGATASQDGFALRVVRVLDSDAIEDVLAMDCFVGTNIVTDRGAMDLNGRFTPAEDPTESGADDLFVRAVALTLGS